MWQEIYHGFRRNTTQPVHVFGLIALIAISVSIYTGAFSVFHSLLQRPLPVASPEQLVWFGLVRPGDQSRPGRGLPFPFFEHLSAAAFFQGVTAQADFDVVVRQGDRRDRLVVQAVNDRYFDLLGISPAVGRFFTTSDSARPDRGNASEAVVSYSYWISRLGGSADAIGTAIVLNRQPFTIVGVTPKGFTGLSVDESPDVRIPLSQVRSVAIEEAASISLEDLTFTVAARLKPGTDRQQAEQMAGTLWDRVSQDLYGPRSSASASVQTQERLVRLRIYPLEHGVSDLRARYSAAIEFATAAATLLFILAALSAGLANLAALSARHQEFAVRQALGASRMRLLGQVMAESMLPVAIGGLAGLCLALAFLNAFPSILAIAVDSVGIAGSVRERLQFDGRAAAISLGMVTFVFLLSGAAPALYGAAVNPSTRMATGGTPRYGAGRRLLVAVQASICVAMIASAFVLVRTAMSLYQLDPGVDSSRVVSVLVRTLAVYGQERLTNAEVGEVMERLRTLPGVESVAVSAKPLFRNTGLRITVVPAGRVFVPAGLLNTSVNSVSLSYFETAGIPLRMGRGYLQQDLYRKTPPFPAIVNEVFAGKILGSDRPVGMTFDTGATANPQPTYEVVGVVANANYRSVREPVPSTVYRLLDLHRLPESDEFSIYIRTFGQARRFLDPVRRVSLTTGLRKYHVEVSSLDRDAFLSIWKELALASMSLFFALFAGLVAAVGIYGTVGAEMIPRIGEAGVRMALGATTGRVVAWIAAQGLRIALPGAIPGVVLFYLVAATLEPLAYGVAPLGGSAVLVAIAVFTGLSVGAVLCCSVVVLRGDIWGAIRNG